MIPVQHEKKGWWTVLEKRFTERKNKYLRAG